METDAEPSFEQFLAAMGTTVGAMVVIALIAWLLVALLAYVVAPADRPWSFFWCTLLLLGPIGVAIALLAQPRRYDNVVVPRA
ncbi:MULTISPECIES: hypothetical protein [Mycolicibacterium]|jgi:hypothetical protein|uniref:Transmembrane protein n=1 Tax=Mycolicibacterium vanbaalenii (strain DSM 7251 / JCM 13017 / BCRC 16820 / KCTC 9966 / NRRL B-24157 / PYR-1) TaxID=350058 RepID=A1TCC2_MYCVP|nr:hypothetical protein [Mycolicibacterium vanbaalenii]ABM14822.1 hypothetical protein Mvan_4045 [Mycolicibacterium vanbaalenii PYR-1]MCV7128278.1 hypothetical protein [Mycolicibacterium vanbaalenii PYR-1]UJL28262.1 hypothetical protein HZU38_26020 [Mycolicibacterium vanbaalenii]WND54955.1 hypothetical protein QQA43_19605 [Mycolicibacterium vanbaalenii]